MPRPSAASRVRTVKASPAALRRLRGTDPVMARLVDEHATLVRRELEQERLGDAYGALLRSIVGQQLSTKAARSIYERVTGLFGGGTPSPEELLAVEPETLRGAGLSRAKVTYMRSLAEHVIDGSLELDRLHELGDDEIVAELTAVKGLGVWTAHMFLIFHLQRPDVLPVGDLGVRNAARALYDLEELPTPAELTELGEPWRPHRSLASLYLWRSLDNEPT